MGVVVSAMCAREGEICRCSGVVSFGVNGRIVTRESPGELKCSRSSFHADPAPGLLKYCECGMRCQGLCQCNGVVRYGTMTQYVDKNVSTEISCNARAFGVDPAPRVREKKCLCFGKRLSQRIYDDTSSMPPQQMRGPPDLVIPARSSPTFAKKCADDKLLKADRSARDVHVFYGLTLIGDPIERGFEIARSQLESMVLSGLLPGANLMIFATHVRKSPIAAPLGGANDVPNDRNVKKALEDLMKIVPNATVSIQFHQEFEFPALRAMWNFALTAPPESLLLYCHNKGVTHSHDLQKSTPGNDDANLRQGYGFRTLYELTIFRQIVGAWPYVLAIFRNDRRIQHVSLVPSKEGVGWYNFFWATPEFIRNHNPPLTPSQVKPRFERHYYETWLGYHLKNQPGCASGYSLAHCQLGHCDGNDPEVELHRYFGVIRNEFAHYTSLS